MTPILIPAQDPDDWKTLLAEPELHWKPGFSARTLAYCWHAAQGFPPEIVNVFSASSVAAFHNITPLLIIPEFKVSFKGIGRDSQNDIFVLAKAGDGELVAITVEGKVEESFGVPLGLWKLAGKGFTENRRKRLEDIEQRLGLAHIPDEIYYQLLHRTASAVIQAKQFNAKYAVMLVHSFSLTGSWFAEYAHFLNLFHAQAEKAHLHYLNIVDGITLYSAWVTGDPRFLSM